jgi:hypothetical protein
MRLPAGGGGGDPGRRIMTLSRIYRRPLFRSIVALTTPAIIFRTSPGNVGQASITACNSTSILGAFSEFSSKLADKVSAY